MRKSQNTGQVSGAIKQDQDQISTFVRERMLSCQDSVVNYTILSRKCLAMPAPEVRPQSGRTRKRWLNIVMQDMKPNRLTTGDVKDRAK